MLRLFPFSVLFALIEWALSDQYCWESWRETKGSGDARYLTVSNALCLFLHIYTMGEKVYKGLTLLESRVSCETRERDPSVAL